jgi:hypothetical protein
MRKVLKQRRQSLAVLRGIGNHKKLNLVIYNHNKTGFPLRLCTHAKENKTGYLRNYIETSCFVTAEGKMLYLLTSYLSILREGQCAHSACNPIICYRLLKLCNSWRKKDSFKRLLTSSGVNFA